MSEKKLCCIECGKDVSKCDWCNESLVFEDDEDDLICLNQGVEHCHLDKCSDEWKDHLFDVQLNAKESGLDLKEAVEK